MTPTWEQNMLLAYGRHFYPMSIVHMHGMCSRTLTNTNLKFRYLFNGDRAAAAPSVKLRNYIGLNTCQYFYFMKRARTVNSTSL